MNAGAYGKEIREVVKEVTCIDENLQVYTLQNENMNFSYRHSRFKEKKEIILKEIREKMEEYNSLRKEKQPTTMPSAGSTFKRGNNFITAKLIDDAGLKGYTIGGAQVSLKHAGFIVNTGNATAKDILDLVEYVTKTVYEKFGKIIELEVEVIGE